MKVLGVIIEIDKLCDFHCREYYIHDEAGQVKEYKFYFIEGWRYGFYRGLVYGFLGGACMVKFLQWAAEQACTASVWSLHNVIRPEGIALF